jgi:hypothetical protein
MQRKQREKRNSKSNLSKKSDTFWTKGTSSSSTTSSSKKSIFQTANESTINRSYTDPITNEIITTERSKKRQKLDEEEDGETKKQRIKQKMAINGFLESRARDEEWDLDFIKNLQMENIVDYRDTEEGNSRQPELYEKNENTDWDQNDPDDPEQVQTWIKQYRSSTMTEMRQKEMTFIKNQQNSSVLNKYISGNYGPALQTLLVDLHTNSTDLRKATLFMLSSSYNTTNRRPKKAPHTLSNAFFNSDVYSSIEYGLRAFDSIDSTNVQRSDDNNDDDKFTRLFQLLPDKFINSLKTELLPLDNHQNNNNNNTVGERGEDRRRRTTKDDGYYAIPLTITWQEDETVSLLLIIVFNPPRRLLSSSSSLDSAVGLTDQVENLKMIAFRFYVNLVDVNI